LPIGADLESILLREPAKSFFNSIDPSRSSNIVFCCDARHAIQTPKVRAMPMPIATPASAAATSIETVSITVRKTPAAKIGSQSLGSIGYEYRIEAFSSLIAC
jgi:hypothetical protein